MARDVKVYSELSTNGGPARGVWLDVPETYPRSGRYDVAGRRLAVYVDGRVALEVHVTPGGMIHVERPEVRAEDIRRIVAGDTQTAREIGTSA